jgi:hypothetical protein
MRLSQQKPIPETPLPENRPIAIEKVKHSYFKKPHNQT